MTRRDRTFEMELEIAAPKAAVWDALSSAEGFARWFAPEGELEPRPGGELVWRWNDFFEWKQRVEAWEPGERLVTRYDSAVDDGRGGKRPLFVEFALEARGEGRTTLRLVHSGFGPEASFDEEYDGISHGWPIELRSLKLYLEEHRGAERRVAWASRAVALPPEEVWARLAGPDGLGFGDRASGAREGDAFELRTPGADTLTGTVLHAQPQELCVQAASHGDGSLRLSADHCAGATHAWLWLATWRPLPDADLDGLRDAWERRLVALFPEAVDPADVQPERATPRRSAAERATTRER